MFSGIALFWCNHVTIAHHVSAFVLKMRLFMGVKRITIP